MGLFKKLREAAEPVSLSPSQRYLQIAPDGQRKNALARACIGRIAGLSVCDASQFGRPVADTYGLSDAATAVRDVLRQDRSMYAWLARDMMVSLDVVLELMMEEGRGTWGENLDSAMMTIGLEPGPQLRKGLERELASDVQERVIGLASYGLKIFWNIAQPDRKELERDGALYKHLFESTDERTELTAHDVAAWSGVIIGRLHGVGCVPASVPWFDRDGAIVPALEESAWYPNPYNRGNIENGDATFQRYWDGRDWTDRIRMRVDGSWNEELHSLRTVPNN
jgi:hypothetical protein